MDKKSVGNNINFSLTMALLMPDSKNITKYPFRDRKHNRTSERFLESES
jgi:hypothetical protein